MRPVVTDRIAWSVGRSVSWSDTVVSPEKMAEPIQMLFGLGAWVGSRNYVLDRGPRAGSGAISK